MQYIFLFFVISIILATLKKYPGIYLAYLFFGQELNSLIFEEVNLHNFRYATIIFILPVYYFYHHNKLDLWLKLRSVLNEKITYGFLLITLYIIIYGLLIGTDYELEYIKMFLFPGFILFFLGAILLIDSSIYKQLFYGIILFSVLTFTFMALFKGLGNTNIILRTEMSELFGIGAISQGRYAALIAMFSVIITVNNKKFLKYFGIFLFIFSLYWLSITGTRGALVSLGLALLFYFSFVNNKLRQYKSAMIFAALATIGLLYIGISESLLFSRLQELTAPGGIESTRRFDRIMIFFNIFDTDILLGLGPGGWGKYVMIGEYRYPHNIFIEFVVEYGIIGLLSFIIIFYYSSKRVVNIIQNNNYDYSLKAIALTWIFFAISAMFSGSFIQGNTVFFTITGIVAGMKYSLIKKQSQHLLQHSNVKF